ncbi:MAG: histidine phosphatase family protein, partial [Gammaproteobacteria bacterium]|nr:histidine phosphatase family protein [Gammaproteobacteria bacterium]
MNKILKAQSRTIYILRHAKSKRPKAGVSDYERTLTDRGIRDASALAQVLSKGNVTLDQIIASSAPRGHDTAQIIIKALSVPVGKVLFDRRLYGATVQRWLNFLRHIDDKSVHNVLLVGHNPDIELLVRRLASIDRLQTPPGGMVALRYTGSWSDIARTTGETARLVWSHYPKRYHDIHPEVMQTISGILKSFRDHLPPAFDLELSRSIADKAVSDAIAKIYRKHRRLYSNPAFLTAGGQAGSDSKTPATASSATTPTSAKGFLARAGSTPKQSKTKAIATKPATAGKKPATKSPKSTTSKAKHSTTKTAKAKPKASKAKSASASAKRRSAKPASASAKHSTTKTAKAKPKASKAKSASASAKRRSAKPASASAK